MPNLPLSEILLIGTTTIFGLISLFFYGRYMREKHKSQFITKNQDKSFDLLNDAIRKAQEILNKAATEQVSALTFTKQKSEQLEKTVETSFEATAKRADQMMSHEIDELHQRLANYTAQLEKAQQDYIAYLKGLELSDNDTKKIAQEAMNQAIQTESMQIKTQLNVFIEKLESELTSFLHKSEEQSIHSLELELKSARQMVETYKQQQFVLIDENIIAILERTLSLVLSKKLTLQDHVDLVYESLEKAKLEKFIA